MKKLLSIILCLMMSPVFAADVTGSQKATATLATSCRFSTTDVIFGDYNPTAEDHLYSNQVVTYTCTKGTPFTLTSSDNVSSTTNAYGVLAEMTNSGTKLYFQVLLHWVSANSWFDDIDSYNGSGNPYKAVGSGSEETLSIQYRVIKNQYIKPGVYSATNNMTFTF